jgi:hypothetical protein
VDVGVDRSGDDLVACSRVKQLLDVLDRGGVSGEEGNADGDAARRHSFLEVVECGPEEVF